MTDPKPRRRRFQYSLRTLLIVMLLVGSGLGWFSHKLQQARRQRVAVTGITNLSGVVGFDDEPANFAAGPPSSPVPQWLRNLLGDDFFRTAVSVVAFNDGSLESAKELTELRRLDFVGGPATDAGLAHVRGLTRLHRLNLSDTQITDAGIEHLQGLTQLRELVLRGTRVTDAGVRQLQLALPNCHIER